MSWKSARRTVGVAAVVGLVAAAVGVTISGTAVGAVPPKAPLQYAGGTTANWYNTAEPTVMMPQFIDWNGDGVRDVVDNGLLFLNIGTDAAPVVQSQGTSLGLPASEGTLLDWDNDGDHDYLARYSLRLYRNTGTDASPAWSDEGALTADGQPIPLLFSDYIRWNESFSPSMSYADWDGDGDRDLLLGVADRTTAGSFKTVYTEGSIFIFENAGTDDVPAFAAGRLLGAVGDPLPAWSASTDYRTGDRVTYDGQVYVASWWTSNQRPGDPYGPWQELALTSDGEPAWSASRIYEAGDVVSYQDMTWRARWYSRNQKPGDPYGPWEQTAAELASLTNPVNAPFRPMIVTADWNVDGHLDVLYGDYRGDLWYLERTGDHVFNPVRIVDTGDVGAVPDVYDRDGDGDLDLTLTSTYGMLMLENSNGELRDAGHVQAPAEGINIHAGLFQTPYVVDWEGDGDLDLVVGDENGRVSIFENMASGGPPQLVNSVPVTAGGESINLDAEDAVGSWEWGPAEAAVGYTNPVVVDWDGDGDLDILTQDAQQATLWLFDNVGTRAAPRYAPQKAFTLDGQTFSQPWRSRVAAMDWDADGDLDLVQASADLSLTVYARDGAASNLTVLDVAKDAAGRPITIASSRDGRTNLQAVDWDGDGLVDLIKSGYGSTPLIWLHNVGTAGHPAFEAEFLRNADDSIFEANSNHTPKTFAIDWDGDGVLDLVDADVWGAIYLANGNVLKHEPVVVTPVGEGHEPRRIEVESLPVASSSGDPLVVYSAGTGYSGTGVLNYEPDAVGDYVGVTVDGIEPGQYRVVVGMRVAPSRATVQVSLGGVSIGGPVNATSTTVGYSEFDLGTTTVAGGGDTELRFTVSARGGGYAMYIDYVDLLPVLPRYEAELLPIADSSGESLGVYVDRSASGGATANFQANGVGDHLDYVIEVPEAGAYRVRTGFRVAANRAVVQLSIDGTHVGPTIDMHAATGYASYDLGSYTFPAAGAYVLRIEVVGKNAASNTYAVYPDYIELS